MKNSELIGVELLREMLIYDPLTGSIRWRHGRSGVPAGAEFGTNKKSSKTTYRIGFVFKKKVTAHRLAWALHFGEWPKGLIDHINHNGLDNRIENLRDVDVSSNNRNTSLRKDSTSGVAGVSWDRSQSKWIAQININRKRVHLGSFVSIEDAIKARTDAASENGYHENHGMREAR